MANSNRRKTSWRHKSSQLPSKLTDELTALGRLDAKAARKRSNAGFKDQKHKQSRTKKKASEESSEKRSTRATDNRFSDNEGPPTAISPEISNAQTRLQPGKRKRGNYDTQSSIAFPSRSIGETPLARLLDQQANPEGNQRRGPRGNGGSNVEQLEDAQIAQLEKALGVKDQKGGSQKLRAEFEVDGLDDLFDDLNALDAMLDGEGDVSDEDATKDFVGSDDEMHDSSQEGHALSASEADSGEIDLTEQGAKAPKQFRGASLDQAMALDVILPTPDQIESSAPPQYVPPARRSQKIGEASSTPTISEQPKLDSRARRELLGLLNRVSPTSIPPTLEKLRALYLSHPRATVSGALIELVLDLVQVNDAMGSPLLLTYVGLFGAVARGGIGLGGIEMGWAAGVTADVVARLCKVYGTEMFSQPSAPIGKQGCNLLLFLSYMYTLDLIGCQLVYDFVRRLINRGLREDSVEGLLVLLKAAGPRLRADDPTALKQIVSLVQSRRSGEDPTSSRTRFMIDALNDLKNNKIQKDAKAATSATEALEGSLRKYLGSVSRKSNITSEPLQIPLQDLQETSKRGRWWLVGAAWTGDPLLEKGKDGLRTDASTSHQLPGIGQSAADDDAMMKLARQHGMNTDVRRGIFVALMSSEDYVDACERINQLGLSDVQQREIVRILLQCLGNEPIYNPYYTLVGQRLSSSSHSMQITLQFGLWDFLRELGERDVGGYAKVKELSEALPAGKVSSKKMKHLARAYGWWIAKGCLSITSLKALPFGTLRPKTTAFLSLLTSAIFLSSQASSPTLAGSTISSRRDSTTLDAVFTKAMPLSILSDGLRTFLEVEYQADWNGDVKQEEVLRWAKKIAAQTLGSISSEMGVF